MSQSASVLSPSPSSHSQALLTTWGCSRPGCSRKRRVRILQLRGRIDGAAILAGVSVLILRAAVRALALDVAVGEEHAFHRIEELRYRFLVDEPRLVELAIDVLRELGIFFRVSRV